MNRFGTIVMCALAIFAVCLPPGAAAAEEQKGREPESKLVKIEQVEVLLSPLGSVVLLKVQDKAIPVFVDVIVAESIQGALTGQKSVRPLSHDLMHSILVGLDAKVSQAVITLKGDTYYGDLTVVQRDSTRVFDSRSSDAIALAIHFKAPILVSQGLIDSRGVSLKPAADEIKL
jgi:bifunctional DNase/RNase